MNSGAPKPWEVWHARFNYSKGLGYKYRPVIVLDVSSDGMLVMMVTSATNKLTLEHDYLIRDWQDAGLDKPSIARADRIVEIPDVYLGTAGKIGLLSSRDAVAISCILHGLVGE